ncbi:glycosyltransferase family 2 protein [Flavobacterium sp. j3]|uniref:Glycosyltransferase family 2 protein n=1 Tax=Flavobacterium aureirubrum TaxID=3133147 RepID=A0ABU9N4W1_9FLAO
MSKITVVMPVYNAQAFLIESIDSILNQTYKDFVFIILNDNSTDKTSEILNSYQIKDKRVIVINKNQNQGPAKLRNEGIKLAQTDLIALMDADDIAHPERFQKQVKLFEQDEFLGLCGTWFTIFGKKNKIIKHSTIDPKLRIQFLDSCGMGNSTVMLKKSKLNGLEFDTDLVPAEDYALWSQLIKKTKFANIPEPLLRYRWHDNNISQTKADNLKKSEIIIRKRQLENFGVLFNDPNIDYFLNTVSLKRNLDKNDILKTINFATLVIEKNKQHRFYNEILLDEHIKKVLRRTILNCKNPDMFFYNSLKSGFYFKSLRLIDKINLFFKCFF